MEDAARVQVLESEQHLVRVRVRVRVRVTVRVRVRVSCAPRAARSGAPR